MPALCHKGMKLRIVRVSRRPDWPLWAVLVVLIWSALGWAAIWLSVNANRHVDLCLFKLFTGTPCPTCGTTRGVWRLLHGHVVQAWLCNPLVFSIGLAFLTVGALRVLFARAVHISLTKNERRIAWFLAVVLLIANWAYVIIYVG